MNKLIIIYGPMCSVKTSITRELCKRLGLILIDSDDVLPTIKPDTLYSSEDRTLMYRATFYFAREIYKTGKDVVVACAFTNEKYIHILEELGIDKILSYSFLLKVKPDVAEKRFLTRKNHPATIQTVDIIKEYASKEFPILPKLYYIDANENVAKSTEEIVKKLAEGKEHTWNFVSN